MRLIDANALRKNMEFICMGIMAGTEPYNAPLTEIDNAPTVEPERPQGEWIIQDGKVVCNRCFEPHLETNYCPNCGAKMS